MTDLISRLREAKEGSSDLNVRVAVWAGALKIRAKNGYWSVWEGDHMWACAGRRIDADDADLFEQAVDAAKTCLSIDRHRYTTDLSAAVALAERVLPHCLIERIGCDGVLSENGAPAIKLVWVAEIARFGETIDAEAPTAPLALCLAVMKARETDP